MFSSRREIYANDTEKTNSRQISYAIFNDKVSYALTNLLIRLRIIFVPLWPYTDLAQALWRKALYFAEIVGKVICFFMFHPLNISPESLLKLHVSFLCVGN